MAIDLCSENPGTGSNMQPISPRISFSYDLTQSDKVPVEQLLRSLSSSSSTVDFNFCVQQNQASMADELFSDGKILPAQIKHQPPPPAVNKNPPPPPDEENQNPSKSFWGFKRSSSCGNGYAKSLCPIPLLNRSNSTGSSFSSKRSKEGSTQKHHCSLQKNSISQKPPLRKTSYSYGGNGSSGNGVRVNPVLNLGFGSFFAGGKDKNKNKKKRSSN